MSQNARSLFSYMKRLENDGHVGSVFVRSGANFMISAVEEDADLPGLWICKGTHGNPIAIDESQIIAIVEHTTVPG